MSPYLVMCAEIDWPDPIGQIPCRVHAALHYRDTVTWVFDYHKNVVRLGIHKECEQLMNFPKLKQSLDCRYVCQEILPRKPASFDHTQYS